MSENRRTWLIEAGDVLEVMSPNRKQETAAGETVTSGLHPATAVRPRSRSDGFDTPRSRTKPGAPPRAGLQFAPLAILTYALGPLAILLTPRGRRSRPAVVAAVAGIGAAAVLVAARFGGVVGEGRPGSAWLWCALLLVAAVGGFSAWAAAVRQIGREGIPPLNRLPHWLRRGWVISLLGLVAPGSGLMLRGHASWAGLVLWLAWPVVAAAVILVNAGPLWRHHLHSGWLASSGPALETVFIVAAALLGLGFLGHITQALEGMRRFTVVPGFKTRVRGDYYALAVVAAVIVLVVAVSPVRMAAQFDAAGDILRQEQFQKIPLALTLAAHRLDPGTPEYSLQAIELYAELGRTQEAETLRQALDANLEIYLALAQQPEAGTTAVPRPQTATAPAAPPVKAKAPKKTEPAQTSLAPEFLVGTMARAAADTADTLPAPVLQSSGHVLGLPPGLPSSAPEEPF